jgi:hypothetical protein
MRAYWSKKATTARLKAKADKLTRGIAREVRNANTDHIQEKLDYVGIPTRDQGADWATHLLSRDEMDVVIARMGGEPARLFEAAQPRLKK